MYSLLCYYNHEGMLLPLVTLIQTSFGSLRYILNVWNSEGVQYDKPKLKMMGIEAVKSSTPAPCRTAIKEALNVIMTGSEENTQKYIKNFREKFEAMTPEEVAFPRGCNNIQKNTSTATIYGKGCPMHVRGALLYNFYIKKRKLHHKYPIIQELSLIHI